MPCYHFMFHGYGTWMPDEDDGYFRRGEGHLPQDTGQAREYRARMTAEEVEFDTSHQLALIDEIRIASNFQAFRVHYVATERTHVHVLVSWQDDECRADTRRSGIRQSLSRRLTKQFGSRQWLSDGGSQRKVLNQGHYDYLVAIYLPEHSGWKWTEDKRLFKYKRQLSVHREQVCSRLMSLNDMATIQPHRPVLLILAAFSRYPEAIAWGKERAEQTWGPMALQSELFEHRETDYYEATMGADLKKTFLAFASLVDPAALVEWKEMTNRWEVNYQRLGRHSEPRPLNLDPGYLTEAKLILASTKDRDHRIYLDRGIYAENTLYFTRGAWQSRPWTYPDYQRADYHEFFGRCREFLRRKQS